MDHLQAIRIFARVVETGSFTQASQSLSVPPATVSKWVRSLETHLGVKLLERTTRSVTVTTDGAAYYERTRHLLSELDDVEATLGRAQGSPRGSLRIDTGGAVASAILIPALPAFHARYPDIQVRLSATDRTADLISENIDCAIRNTQDDPDLVSVAIGKLRWTTCASPAWLARHGTPKHPHDIVVRKMPVAGYFSASTGITQPLRFECGDEQIELEGVHHDVLVSDSSAHLATALAGLGLVHTLDFMVRPSVERGLLVPVLSRWSPAPIDVYAAYPPSRRHSTKVRVFVDWVTTLFRAL
jgi:DNA-binding transcriptional LysR family regulator